MSTSIIAGSLFEFSEDSGITWKTLNGIPEMPEFKTERGEREVTTISDTVRQYDEEMDSPTEVTLNANYLKSDTDQLAFRTLARSLSSVAIRVTYSDGDTVQMDADLKNYGISGGEASSTKQWSCVIRRTTAITHTEATS